jgi:hypothetical protein
MTGRITNNCPHWHVLRTRDSAVKDRAAEFSLYFDPDRGVVPKQAEIDMKGFTRCFKSWPKLASFIPRSPPPPVS